MQKKIKRRWGDKREARLIKGKELDTNHYIMPLVWPNKTDNEAYISETIDLTSIDEYLKNKNTNNNGAKYSMLMVLLAAMGKTFLNRPKMNRYYKNGKLYERYRVSIGFIVRKGLTDDAEEGLARVYVDPEDTFLSFAKKVQDQIEFCRTQMDTSSDDIRILMKFPHFVGRLFMGFVKWLDKHGWVPKSIIASDMSYASIIVSHLGSVGMHAGYHHLANWGTNSYFTVIGEKKVRPFFDKFGKMQLKDSVDLGITLDERIADGFYFSKTIMYLKKLFANPGLLDTPFLQEKPAD